jgi:hypothetical protein
MQTTNKFFNKLPTSPRTLEITETAQGLFNYYQIFSREQKKVGHVLLRNLAKIELVKRAYF